MAALPRERAGKVGASGAGALALITGAGPPLFLIGAALLPTAVPVDPQLALLGASVLVSLGGAVAIGRSGPGRALAAIGLAAFLGLTFSSLLDSPNRALSVWLVVAGLGVLLWWAPGAGRGAALQSPAGAALAARSAAAASLGTFVLMHLMGGGDDPARHAAAVASFAVAGGFAAVWGVRERGLGRARTPAFLAFLLAAALLIEAGSGLVALTLPPLAVLALAWPPRSGMTRSSWWDPVLQHPARVLVLSFAGLCLVGALVLLLPACAATSRQVDAIDAAFTAVSAVCVTGLVVLDTAVDFSGAGQVAILILIQLGGLGIMTFATAILGALGRRLSVRHEGALAELISIDHRGRMYGAIRRILGLTFAVEAAGAALLAPRFLAHGDSAPAAVWRAVFTSVSAFCNAGFALQTNSLIPYQRDPWVLHCVAALIILGGLSPPIVLMLPRLGRRRRLDLPARIVLVTSGALLLGGTVFLAAVEWAGALEGLPLWDRLHNAWFQSVTLRTAGFNSIDLALLHPASVTLAIVWMFIGGSPGGTAGGVKTTTAAVLALAAAAAVRGRDQAVAFRRTIPHPAVYRAASIATFGLAAVLLTFVAVQVTQALPAGAALFEVVSALGTVGQSLGATSHLDGVGKVIIILAMFVGRVGPLTLFMFLVARSPRPGWTYPGENVTVG